MSTPRKRTAAEAERVRQVNLLARLHRSAVIADALQRSKPVTDVTPFAQWLHGYTQEYLANGLGRRNASSQINLTALTSAVKHMGANPKSGEWPTRMAEAVVETRQVAIGRREARSESNPFTVDGKTNNGMQQRYQEVAARKIVRAYAEIAGWTRMAYAYQECCWRHRVKFDETLDAIRREEAQTLDTEPKFS